MLKALPFKTTSDYFLLWVFLRLLWGVTGFTITSSPNTKATVTNAAGITPSTPLTIPKVKIPEPVKDVKVVTQTETSVTLMWDKVNDISTYILKYNDSESAIERPINVSNQMSPVEHVVSPLTAATKYDFTLITVVGGFNSTGHTFSAVTAPPNAEEFKSVGQNETSVTLQWKKVEDILNYTLVFSLDEINITASAGQEPVTHIIPGLTNAKQFYFTLYTVYEDIRSSGANLTAVTAPPNAEEFKSVEQTETSVTLQWKKVEDILNYTLVFGQEEINVSASVEDEKVTYTISGLRSGNKYNFTLFTVFEDVRSSGANLAAVTVPEPVKDVKVVTQTETSITLMWDKVNDISTYILKYNDSGSAIERPINVSNQMSPVEHVVSPLTAATKYDFTLITVFGGFNSTGHTFSAVTAPPNAEEFKSVGQNETSVTLQWKKVEDILNYTLVFSLDEINITASAGQEPVTHIIPGLTNAKKFYFTLYTVYEDIRSSGANLTAVTAPPNAEEFKSVEQTETSVTLQWKKVEDILNYTLVFGQEEINVSASVEDEKVTYTISGLRSGNKYNFTLFTVFEDVRSSGANLAAVTVPEPVKDVKVVTQTETSVTLMWDKVNDISTYILKYNDSGSAIERPINVSNQMSPVEHVVSPLTAATKYDFTLITVFGGFNSTGHTFSAVTAPPNAEEFKSVGQNETSITLQWKKVEDILNYTLVFSLDEINITASAGQEPVTHIIPGLTNAKKFYFTLYTVYEDIRSSGANLTAVTAPPNAEEFKSVEQNETSITLQWRKVEDILSYTRVFGQEEKNIIASVEDEKVKNTISGLRSGNKYNFTLYTVYEDIRSSGANLTAVTAPRNAEEFKSVEQTETSVTLQWKKVEDILNYTLVCGQEEINVSASVEDEKVTYTISGLRSGNKYNFTLFTVFEDVRSSGANLAAVTVPPKVSLVNVTERSVTSITLEWEKLDKDWTFLLHIDGRVLPVNPDVSPRVSYSITSLQPGTEYPFKVITVFSSLESAAYEGFTVTAIDCTSVTWSVTNSSIQGTVEGLFSNATAFYNQTHVSPGGHKVSFSGLYPGATYEVSLVYERNSVVFEQCRHNITIRPPTPHAHCKYFDGGYSILIAWNKPDGVWTEVVVNVNGQSHRVFENGSRPQQKQIHGLLPARTYEVSVTSLSGKVASYEPFVFLCSTDPRGVIAGSVLAVLLFGVLVCLAMFILYKRRGLIRKNPFIGGSKLANKMPKAIPVSKFPHHFLQLSMDDQRGFTEEYENLVPVGSEQTQKVALLPENKPKNRFSNVLPFDWCRVKLITSNPDGICDYINASYMPGYSSNREYIATQGPLPTTVVDFWRMIWEQGVTSIVMVTNCVEGGRTKCEQYWPAQNTPCLYGELLVTMRSEQQEPNWTLREFNLKQRNTSEECTVKHFHFTAWPDHGVPQSTSVLIQFRGLVRRHIEREGAGVPTVVHCSAGVGRTGTLIALDVLLQQLDKKKAVGINGFVHRMRLCRPHMVQTESQYVFLHQCIMDFLQPEEKIEDNIYENVDMIYVNATVLRELR